MQKFLYNFVTYFYILLILPISALGENCSYNLKSATASISSNGVPLYVENSKFSKKILNKLKRRALKAKKKYNTINTKRCPELTEQVNTLMERLLTSSNLAFLLDNEDRLEVVLLCSKTDTPPVARIVAGKYLLIPASLPQKAKSLDALAAVLSHEIAHYTLRHHARLLEELNGRFPSGDRSFLNRIKRHHEKEADLTGLELMTNAGFSPQAAVSHLKHVKDFLDKRKHRVKAKGSHPSPTDRELLLTEQIKKCSYRAIEKTANSTKVNPIHDSKKT